MRRAMAVQSPCIKICTLDPAGEVCTGCGRTIAEIARWSQMDDSERRSVIMRAKRRMAAPEDEGGSVHG